MTIAALHGFLGAPSMWEPLRLALPTLVAIELPGHGAAPPPRDASFLDACRDLASKVPSSVRMLVGYSMGGRIALGMLASDPTRFDAAVVLGAHLGPRDESERKAMRTQEVELSSALDLGMSSLVDRFEALPLFASQSTLPAEVRLAQRKARLAHSPEAIRSAMTVLATSRMPDLRDALRTTATRVTFVAGELDHKYVALAQDGAALSSRHASAILGGVGHNLVLEAAPAVVEIIAAVESSIR